MKRRGRPKGSDITVIGLPAKKKKSNKPVPFMRRHSSEKQKGCLASCICTYVFCNYITIIVPVMLSWFVDQCKIDPVLRKGEVIEESEVECRPERISSAILDESVDIYLIRHYFTNDAWLLVQDVLKRKSENHVWICKRCNHDIDEDSSEAILCDVCLLDFRCVGIIKQPKQKNWYCRQCYNDAK